MGVLAHHVLLGLSIAALAGAGLRLAGAAGARGLARVLAAATIAFGAAVVEALALGLVGEGGSPLALAGAAGLTWLGARTLIAAAEPAPRHELAAWWDGMGGAGQIAAGVGTALALGLVAWQVRHPYLGLDALVYHLSLPALWVQHGRPGALVDVFPGLPVANYPVTSEVWVGWAVGISRSWVTASVVNVGLAVLAAAGAALGLRAAGASRLAAGLGAGALVALPLLTFQLGGPDTDLATLAWVVVAAGLAAAAARDGNPGLLAVALVAGGLAVGAKTTAALPTAAALLAAAWALRDRLRPALGALAAGAVAAVLVGGLWPLRNLVLHGSPLWPFARGPFGDPLPAALTAVHGSFLSRPGALLDGRVDDYVKTLSGGLLLLAGGLVAPLLRRSRLAVGAGAVTALAVLAWMAAPFTGIDADKFAVGALRYLLPALAAATAALCLAGIGARRGLQRAVVGVLIAALAWSALRTLDLGFPFVPSLGVVVAFVVLGAAGGALAGRLRLGRPAAWLAPALAVVAGGVLAVGADGYVVRHAEGARLDGGVLLALSAQPGYADGDAPVAIGPAVVPLVAGDGLRHRVVRLGTDAPCATVSRQARLGWVALQTTPRAAYERLSGCLAGARPVWSNAKWSLYRGVGG